MTISVGPKGYVELVSAGVGPKRKVKIVSFIGAASAGEIAGPHFTTAGEKKSLRAVIDMNTGLNSTAYYRDTGAAPGDLHISQVDTGGGGNFDGHTMWAIITDTGT